jgi:hypothetical protein
MGKYQTPDYYKAPLKSRADIAAFLAKQKSYGSWNDYCRFVWDVKLYGVCLEYDHLLEIHKKSGYCSLDNIDDPAVQKLYHKHYKGEEDNLYEIAVEDAWEDVNGSDCYTHLYDGTNCDAKFASYGRSGGYIGLNGFLKYSDAKSTYIYDFTDHDSDYWNAVFRGNPYPHGSRASEDWFSEYRELPFPDLRLLYRLVVMLNHDFTRDAACEAVEHQAAYHVFARHEDEIEDELAAHPPKIVLPKPPLVIGGARRLKL